MIHLLLADAVIIE